MKKVLSVLLLICLLIGGGRWNGSMWAADLEMSARRFRKSEVSEKIPEALERDGVSGGPRAVVSEAVAVPGEEVTLTVSLENNPGIISMAFYVSYDPSLALTKLDPYDEKGNLLFDVPGSGMQWLTETTPTALKKNPKRMSFGADTSRFNVELNGVILKMTFMLPDDAEVGEWLPVDIRFGTDRPTVYNLVLDPVAFDTQAGGIRVVTCSHRQRQVTEAKAPSCTEAGRTESAVCEGCGEILLKSEELPALGHSLALREFTSPTKETPGNIRYYLCTRCGACFADPEGNALPGDGGVQIPYTGATVKLTGNASYRAGETFRLGIELENFPTVDRIRLRFTYPPEAIKFLTVYEGTLLTLRKIEVGDSSLTWVFGGEGSERLSGNGLLATVCLRALPQSAGIAFFGLEVEYEDGAREETGAPVYVATQDLKAEVAETLWGDVDESGKVSAPDRTALARYLAGWADYARIDMFAADMDHDGKVTTRDRVILARQIAKWN